MVESVERAGVEITSFGSRDQELIVEFFVHGPVLQAGYSFGLWLDQKGSPSLVQVPIRIPTAEDWWGWRHSNGDPWRPRDPYNLPSEQLDPESVLVQSGSGHGGVRGGRYIVIGSAGEIALGPVGPRSDPFQISITPFLDEREGPCGQ